MDPPRLPSRANLARFGAPAAFLAAVTVAVLLIRAGLSGSDSAPATTVTPTAATTSSKPATTTSRTRTATTTTTAEEPRFYTVESGDTYGSIAAELNTSVDRLRELNPDVDETQLTIGQRIRVG